MTTGSIGPGTVLAGRYRLDDLLSESEGARFWRATDTILARSVAIHAVPTDDPRAPGLMEAARVSATVIDPHLLRVLDCDDDDGITWVVNEWGEGISLDRMLQQGTLPPSRAAWLTREVAEAIAAGHAQGVAHGRLNPEAVLVTHAGAVKLIGYVVDASLEMSRPPDPLYGELDEREADVINLAGILYAALTGRWPGVARSAVPKAPRESRRPLRPRQVRAGVPRTLDAICERVLHKEGSQHALPIETAHEIAAALADYVGDPALSAPVDAAGMHAEPTVSLHRDALPSSLSHLAAGAPEQEDAPEGGPAGASEDAPADSPEDLSEEGLADATAGHLGSDEADTDADAQPVSGPVSGLAGSEVADPEATQISPSVPVERGQADPGATQAFRVPVDRDDSPNPAPPSESSPPPFPDVPERPLYAETARRVPAAARAAGLEAAQRAADRATEKAEAEAAQAAAGSRHYSATGTQAGVSDALANSGSFHPGGEHERATGNGEPDYWPFAAEPEEGDVHTGKEGRGWLRVAIVVGVLLVLVVAMAIAFNAGRGDGETPSGSDGDSTSGAKAAGSPVKLAGVRDFDPLADPPEENPEDAPNAIDKDSATSWTTSTYRGNPALGGLKPGVGLMVDLGKDVEAKSVTVRFKGEPTSFEVHAAPAGVTESPESLNELDKVAARADSPARATLELDPSPTTRYLLVWLTKLPPVSGGFRGEITDITVTS